MTMEYSPRIRSLIALFFVLYLWLILILVYIETEAQFTQIRHYCREAILTNLSFVTTGNTTWRRA